MSRHYAVHVHLSSAPERRATAVPDRGPEIYRLWGLVRLALVKLATEAVANLPPVVLISALFAAIASSTPAQAAEPPRRPELLPEQAPQELALELGEPVKFLIRPEVESAPPWIRVRVEQQGCDVALELRDEGGTAHLADQPLGYHQPELLVVPAGTYELLIHVRVPGQARVSWQGLPDTDHRLAADLAWTEGTDHFRRDGEASLRVSRRAFLEAAESYSSLGLTAAQGRSLMAAGHLAADVGDLDDGLAWHRRSVELRQQARDSYGEADAWQQVGHGLRLQGKFDEARSALEKALEISASRGDHRGQARALLNLGFIEQGASRRRQARQRYERALTLLEGARDPSLESKLLNNLAGLDYESGRLREAAASFEKLLDFELGVADPRARARTLINLGTARRHLGRYQASLDAFDAALESLAGVGEIRLESSVLNNLGFVYFRLGDLDRADGRFQQALKKRRAAGDGRATSTTLYNIGLVATAAEQWPRAKDAFEQSLEISRGLDDARGQARALHGLGRIELFSGRPAEARDPLEWAMLARRELGDVRGQASTAAELAKVYSELERGEEALELANLSVSTYRRLGSRGDEAQALLTRLRILRRFDRADQAGRDVERALELAESLRLDIESPDLRATLLTVVRDLYGEIVDLKVEIGDWRGAFEIAERARARAFLDVLEGAGSSLLRPEMRAEHRELVEDLAGLRYAMNRARRRGQAPPEELETAWRELTLEIDRLEHSSPFASPVSERLAPGGDDNAVLGIEKFQGLLDPETLALVFFLGERRSFLWLIERDRASFRILPPRRELVSISEKAIELFRVFDPRGAAAIAEAGEKLTTSLLAGALENRDAKRLVLVPEGPLLRLPFAALPTGDGRLLIDRFELSYLPSASTLPALRDLAAEPPATGGLALIADPDYSEPDDSETDREAFALSKAALSRSALPRSALSRPVLSQLDGSRKEAQSLAGLEGVKLRSWLGGDAQRQEILGAALEPYRYVHFATHATVDAARPELSALILSLRDREGRAVEGHLRLADVYAMSLQAELVVLSGCDTGLGRDVEGEGLLGLARGFFFAGAARVASSLWRVEDDATAELMSRFYRFLLVDHETPSAALRRAQLSLRAERRYRHPFFWAAFTIQGDWRAPHRGAP